MTTATKLRKVMSVEDLIEALDIEIINPEDNKITLNNVVGLNEPKKYVTHSINVFKNPNSDKYKNATLLRKFMFMGPDGAGKTMLATAMAKELNLPIIIVKSENFINSKALLLMEDFQIILEKYSPAVVLFKNFTYTCSLVKDTKNFPFFATLVNYTKLYNYCFFVTTISIHNAPFPQFFVENDAFNIQLDFDLPDLKQREQIIIEALKLFPHEKNIDVNRIAKNTTSCSGGDILDLLRQSYDYALMNNKSEIDFLSIDNTLSNATLGHKQKTMTEKERKYTAYHEAGHVVAGYFADPENYKLSKVEIAHRSESLGITIAETDEENYSYFKSFFENEIIMCYGGMVAERLMFGQNTSGVCADLSTATQIANSMVTLFGMSDELGPISIASDEDDDIPFYSNILSDKADLITQNMLKKLYHKTEKIMKKHKKVLEAIANALLEKETLYVEDLTEILKRFEK